MNQAQAVSRPNAYHTNVRKLSLLALLVLLSSLWFQFGNPSGGSQSRGGGRLQ